MILHLCLQFFGAYLLNAFTLTERFGNLEVMSTAVPPDPGSPSESSGGNDSDRSETGRLRKRNKSGKIAIIALNYDQLLLV